MSGMELLEHLDSESINFANVLTISTGSIDFVNNALAVTSDFDLKKVKTFAYDNTSDKEGWYIDEKHDGKFVANDDITSLTDNNMNTIETSGVKPFEHALQMDEDTYKSKINGDF